MARPLRLLVPGGVYHVITRGNARQDVFADDCDRQCFLSVLCAVCQRLNVQCHAFCLMSNHYHLLLETPDANLSHTVRNLNGVYAQSFNHRHGRVGHLFQGRYSSKLVEKDAYLLVVARYIVLNPVRAHLVPHPAEWNWSSYRAHAGLVDPPPFLTRDWLLTCFGATDRSQAHEAYRRFIHDGQDDPKPDDFDVPIVGSEAFVASFRQGLAATGSVKAIPRAQRFAARPTLQEIFAGCLGRRERNGRIREAHVNHGYTMTAIATHLRLHVMTVSRAVHLDVRM